MTTEKVFLIAGLGASAGGIKAFQHFFANVPDQSGVAYVVILHMSPEHESHLAEILQLTTAMPVTQVREAVKIKPDNVYVISPNNSLAMYDGTLTVSQITRIEERRAPVDIFFRTLAETHDAHAVCVVLSGTGADGSMGLKRIKERGGICFAQEPREAEFNDMPHNAIATGFVDYVLPAAEIPARIVAYKESFSQVKAPVEMHEQSERDERAILDVLTQLRTRTGQDFTHYKRATVLRRIGRRINVHELPDLQAYAAFMREDREEAQALLKDLLISVTNFFRDREAFERLEHDIIPQLFAGKGAEDHVRVWTAGCATGEEAYTLAMLLTEHAETLTDVPHVRVFATDIDEAAVGTAREGLYTLNDAADVSPERLRRFFVKEGKCFRVRKELRKMVLFAQHNLIKDPPFSHLDLVTCRNLFIYLNRTAQSRAMEIFHFALRPGGFLLLGSSESIDGAGELFLTIDKDARIFESRHVAPRLTIPVPDLSSTLRLDQPRKPERGAETRAQQGRLSYADLHQRLLERYAAPSIVVTEDYTIVHLSERAGRYLQHAGGAPSHNLLEAVRPELRPDLRTALYQAVQKGADVEARGVRVRIEDQIVHLNLRVRPTLREGDPARGLLLVLFEETDGAAATDIHSENVIAAVEPAAQQLEEELSRVKAQLRSAVDQYETQAADLKASNEELQAINEESRSSTEELETSREELQSVNEELMTVNQELKINFDELNQSNNDIRNLINSTDIGTIFLDRSLHLKFFTPRARNIFNLIPADAGRPLLDITSKLLYEDLHRDIEHVLDTLQPIEREVATRDDRWHLMRVLPYRTTEDRIDGVVVTFTDITNRKLSEEALRKSEERLQELIRNLPGGAAFIVDRDLRYLVAEGEALAAAGFKPEDLIGKTMFEVFSPDIAATYAAVYRKVLAGESFMQEHDGYGGTYLTRGTPLRSAGGEVYAALAVSYDISDRKEAEERLRESEERFRAMFEQANVGFVQTSFDEQLLKVNPGFCKFIGYTEDEVRGLTIRDITHPEDYEREQKLILRLMAGEVSGYAIEKRYFHKTNGIVWGYMTATLMRRESGEPFYTLSIIEDISERKQAEEALRRSRDELETRVDERTSELSVAIEALIAEVHERAAAQERARSLMKMIVTAQEDERLRIARDLHDQLGQQLTGLRLKLETHKQHCGNNAESCGEIEEIQEIARQIDEDVDFLAWELRPVSLDELGLATALSTFVREWSQHVGIPAQFHTTFSDQDRLSPEAEINFYRIAQEALNNICKHAEATSVDVIFEHVDGDAVLIIEDNGKGFDPNGAAPRDSKMIGLINMRERAAFIGGTLEIESEFGEGTTVFARAPVSVGGGQ